MGKRGPIPNPHSGRTARRLNSLANRRKTVPAADFGVATMPDWLPKAAKVFWERNAPRIEKLGRLTALDQTAFAMLAVAWAQVVESAGIIAREGVTVLGPRGRIAPHPAVKIHLQAQKQFLQFASDFGLTPASRARYGFESELPDTADPFDEWLDGGNVRPIRGKQDAAPDDQGPAE